MNLMANCRNCPFLGIDGGPGSSSVCDHRDAEDHGYIVRWIVDEHGRRREQVSNNCPMTDEVRLMVQTINNLRGIV